MKKSVKSGIIVFIILLVVIAGLNVYESLRPSTGIEFNSTSNVTDIMEEKLENRINSKAYGKKFIAAVKIEGTIQEANNNYNQNWILSTIEELKHNENNQALAVFINSPGGAVYQADEVYLALQDYRTSGKPVYVYQGSMAASGGYYISCAANKIYANRNTLTGCIGVIMGTTYDLTGLFEKIGIKSETIHSGKNKNMMNYNEPLTDEQRDIMQAICDECYKQFVDIVAKNRHMPTPKAKNLSDGRLYTANQALENGLIDAVDSWDHMIDDLANDELKMPGLKVKVYQYKRKNNFRDIVLGSAKELSQAKTAATLGLPVSVVEEMNNLPMTPMYLYK